MVEYNISKTTLGLINPHNEDYCESCFWWKVKKKGIDHKPIRSNMPNRVEDAILNYWLKDRVAGKLPDELKGLESGEWKLIDSELHKKWKHGLTNDLFGKIKSNGGNVYRIPLMADDALINPKDNSVIVLDIKTVGFQDENVTDCKLQEDIEKYGYKLQLALYSYIINIHGYKAKPYGYLYFTWIKNKESDEKYIFNKKILKVEFDNPLNLIKEYLDRADIILEKETAPEPSKEAKKSGKNGCLHCQSNKEYLEYQDFLPKELDIDSIELE